MRDLFNTIATRPSAVLFGLQAFACVYVMSGCTASPNIAAPEQPQTILVPEQPYQGDEEGPSDVDQDPITEGEGADMGLPIEMDMETPPPPMCDIPNGSRCVGDVYEECRGGALVQINCAAQEERCVSDAAGARCEEEQQVIDLCADNYCSDHGWCDEGSCLCDPGYTGADCELCDVGWQLNEFDFCEPLTRLYGTADDDELYGGDAGEIIRGRAGDDTLKGFGGEDYINGNAGNDFINGNTGRDSVHGGSGDDIVNGGQDDDVLFGNIGDDELAGGFGNDRLIGGDGDDELLGGPGDDRYFLDGLGHDAIDDDEGFNVARCGPGVVVTQHVLIDQDSGAYEITFQSSGTVTYFASDLTEILGCNLNP